MTTQIGEICEADYCNDLQTSAEAANYGMCDGCYEGSLWYCERCESPEGQKCWHKVKVEK